MAQPSPETQMQTDVSGLVHNLRYGEQQEVGRAMTPTLEVVRDEDIERRRIELIRRAGLSVPKMREMAKTYDLDQEHQAILREIDELDFLSGK